MRVLLAGMVLLVCAACAGGDGGGESFQLYHLETAIGRPGTTGELRCGPPTPACPGVITQPPPGEVHYPLRGKPGVGDDGIDRAGVRAEESVVIVPFTAAGTKAFAALTREVAHYGGRDQGWHHVAAVVGDEIVAFPEVDFDIHPNGIAGAPSLHIAVGSAAAARDLAERLRGG
jgi:hypothetical protein